MAASSVPFPMLDSENYTSWRFRIRLILQKEEAIEALDIKEEKHATLTGDLLKVFNKLDLKAMCIIAQSVSDKYIEYVENATSAKQMMEKLHNVFQRGGALSKMYLLRKLLKMKFTEGELQVHFNGFEKLVKQLDAVSNTPIDDTDKICYLLLTMPEKFESVITSIETVMNKDNTKYTYAEVKTRLLDAELKTVETGAAIDNSGSYSFPAQNSKDNKSLENIICHGCGGKGHYKTVCPTVNQNARNLNNSRGGRSKYRGRGRGIGRLEGRSNEKQYQKSNVAQSEEAKKCSDFDFIATDYSKIDGSAFVVKQQEGHTHFVLDSGATNHWVSQKLEKYMNSVEEMPQAMQIKIANGEYIKGTKRGLLGLKVFNSKTNDYSSITISAIIVPSSNYNLLSVKRLSVKGYEVKFEKGGEYAMIMNDKLHLQCKSFGNLYVTKFLLQTVDSEECHIATSAEAMLWHQRLGHLNEQSLKLMKLPGNYGMCSPCNQGKAKRKPFKNVELSRSSKIGELIHSDLAGPFKTETLNGERYYQTITDDHSHFVKVYLLKTKDEAESNIMNYVRELKAKGYYCSRIRSDGGGEFSSNALKNFCKQKGIVNEYSLHYTPQQDGVSERLNFTLMSKVRTLFAETNLPKYLWGEAICCVAYQLNRSPTKTLNGKIPAQVFLGKFDLKKLKVFGSKAWAYKLPVPADKLATRAVECVMVGYGSNGYRVWNPASNKVFKSRDIRFDENTFVHKAKENLYVPPLIIDSDSSEQVPTQEQCSIQNVQNNVAPLGSIVNKHGLKKSTRATKIPSKFDQFVVYKDQDDKDSDIDSVNLAFSLCTGIPSNYDEAITSDKEWKYAVQKEIDALVKYDTWKNADLPQGSKAIDTRWIFTIKADGTKRARLVAKGYQEQVASNLYAPVAQLPTIRLFMSVALQRKWEIRQLDIPSAFLNGKLDSDVYIKPPKGVTSSTNVLKLNKSLYGLRSAPRSWNDMFNAAVVKYGLTRSARDFCLYSGEDVYLIIWVDDILIAGNSTQCIKLSDYLKTNFNAKDFGIVNNFLGSQITVKENSISISQKDFIQKMIKKFGMQDCKTMSTPMESNFQLDKSLPVNTSYPYRELIGSLIYISIVSRPDISFATSVLSRYVSKPNDQVWIAAKRILRYLSNTVDKSLTLYRQSGDNITAYSDADWAGDITDRKSTSGCIIYHCGNPISWYARKQTCISQSTAEAEYIACATAAMDVVYFQSILQDLNCNELKTPVIYVDNQSAINISESFENSKRTRHIDIKYHLIKDYVQNNFVTLNYIRSNDNIADIFTKALNAVKFNNFFVKLNIV
uniref:Integrase catalytic domain-containing protein n=2 Tax=Clastoptera arizonana TaxID=38151 RepID=A0A1B6DFK3_9HEMI